MNEMSEEEKKRIRGTPIQELLESGEWVKLYDAINPSLKLYDSVYTLEDVDKYFFFCSECNQLAERGRLGMRDSEFMCTNCGYIHCLKETTKTEAPI